MNFFKKMLLLAKDNKAQAMTEYILITGALLGTLAICSGPIPIFPMTIEMFQAYIDSMHMVITLPIP